MSMRDLVTFTVLYKDVIQVRVHVIDEIIKNCLDHDLRFD